MSREAEMQAEKERGRGRPKLPQARDRRLSVRTYADVQEKVRRNGTQWLEQLVRGAPEEARMSPLDAAREAVRRLEAGGVAWVPVFADVAVEDHIVGHVVSDGYSQRTWVFHPKDASRQRKTTCFDEIGDIEGEAMLPAWCKNAALENVRIG